MSSVVISGDTSGAITLSAPAVAGTNTITLPASTGTVLTTGSPQSGGVIQVVSTSSTTTTSTSSTSFVTASISASITPKFSTSKILITVAGGGMDTWQSSNNRMGLTVYRNNATQLGGFTDSFNYQSRTIVPASYQYLDSPATTSSTTYTIYIKSFGAYDVYLNSQSETITIIVMEIAV